MGVQRGGATRRVVCQQRCDLAAATGRGGWTLRHVGREQLGLGGASHPDLYTPFQAGDRLLVGHTFDDTPYQVEVSYFWLSAWNTSAQFLSDRSLFSPFTNFGSPANSSVDGNSSVQVNEVSRLESGEVNFKYALSLPAGEPTVVLMVGVRHVGVREEFDYASSQGRPAPIRSPYTPIRTTISGGRRLADWRNMVVTTCGCVSRGRRPSATILSIET